MINNRRTICILGGTGTVGVTACKVLSKLGYSLRVSVRNIETIKDTGMYMAPNIQLFELDIDKESNIGKFFKGSDLVIGAIGPSADYSEKMLLGAMAENSTLDSLMSWNYQSVEKILNQLTKMHFRTAKLSETLLLAIKAR